MLLAPEYRKGSAITKTNAVDLSIGMPKTWKHGINPSKDEKKVYSQNNNASTRNRIENLVMFIGVYYFEAVSDRVKPIISRL